MDLSFFQTLILSAVEGVTEFLPISSTGHLILASEILKIPQTDFVKSFEIIIQLGAILAVVVLYGKTLLVDRKTLFRTLAAFIPSGILGFILYKFIKDFLIGNVSVVLWSLLLGGIAIILIEFLLKKKKEKSCLQINEMSYQKAVAIGIFQSLSIIPGVSRAAATIIGSRIVDLSAFESVKFSFLLAIPTMFAATALDLYQSAGSFDLSQIQAIVLGFIASFIVAIIVVKWFLDFVKKYSLIPFGIYRIILAIVFYLVFLR